MKILFALVALLAAALTIHAASRPGASDLNAGEVAARLGAGIQGGETRRLAKGDVVVIPARTPHWFKEAPKSVSYFLVKVIQQ